MAALSTNIPMMKPGAGFGTVLSRFRQWYANRRTAQTLSRLTPEQLEDIGLNRADIEDFFLIRN